jgi:predicted ATP-dependent serine protease
MEIALRVASSGTKVLFATSEEIFKSEFARYDLESRMKEKAEILGLSWQNIVQNLYILDVITHSDLREWTTFVSTYRALIEKEGISLTLIDSLTLLEDTRGQLKYRLSELIKYNQRHGINAIYISQRSGDDPDSIGSLAGGIALSHITDIVFEMDSKKVSSWDSALKQDIPTAKQGTEVYFFKVLKNRLTRFNGRYIGYTITKDGIVKPL